MKTLIRKLCDFGIGIKVIFREFLYPVFLVLLAFSVFCGIIGLLVFSFTWFMIYVLSPTFLINLPPQQQNETLLNLFFLTISIAILFCLMICRIVKLGHDERINKKFDKLV